MYNRIWHFCVWAFDSWIKKDNKVFYFTQKLWLKNLLKHWFIAHSIYPYATMNVPFPVKKNWQLQAKLIYLFVEESLTNSPTLQWQLSSCELKWDSNASLSDGNAQSYFYHTFFHWHNKPLIELINKLENNNIDLIKIYI